jgi:hypothetical protein
MSSFFRALEERFESRRLRAALFHNPEAAAILQDAIQAAAAFAEAGQPVRAYTWCAAIALTVEGMEAEQGQAEGRAREHCQLLLSHLDRDDAATSGFAALLEKCLQYDADATIAVSEELIQALRMIFQEEVT